MTPTSRLTVLHFATSNRRLRLARVILAAALCGSALLHSRRAAAQAAEPPVASDPNRDASARALFDEGVKAAEHGDWEAAEDRFRRALTLRSSTVIAYNLASALVQRGKLVEASELLRRVLNDDKADASMHASAQRMAAEIAPRIGRITVYAPNKQAGDAVLLDANPLLDAQLEVEIPIDPGAHTLNLSRGTETLATQAVTIADGGNERVTLNAPLPVAPPAQAARSVVESPAPAAPVLVPVPSHAAADSGKRDQGSSFVSSPWFWGGVGAVVVGAAVLGVVLATSGGTTKTEAPFKGNFTPGSLQIGVGK